MGISSPTITSLPPDAPTVGTPVGDATVTAPPSGDAADSLVLADSTATTSFSPKQESVSQFTPKQFVPYQKDIPAPMPTPVEPAPVKQEPSPVQQTPTPSPVQQTPVKQTSTVTPTVTPEIPAASVAAATGDAAKVEATPPASTPPLGGSSDAKEAATAPATVAGASDAAKGAVVQAGGDTNAMIRDLLKSIAELLQKLVTQLTNMLAPKAVPTPPPPPPIGPPKGGSTPPPVVITPKAEDISLPPVSDKDAVAGANDTPPVVVPPVVGAPPAIISPPPVKQTDDPVQVEVPKGGPVIEPPVVQLPVPPKDTSTVTIGDSAKTNGVILKSSLGTSVELWGDPHVVINVDGKEEKFDIGYGEGSITLSDGTAIRWDTVDSGARKFWMEDMTVDYATGTDAFVNANDNVKSAAIMTRLTDSQLREFIEELRMYKGPMSSPLTRIAPPTPTAPPVVAKPTQDTPPVPTQA